MIQIKSADETIKIIEETLDYNKGAQKTFDCIQSS